MPLTKLSGLQIETPVDISAANLTGITTATDLNATRINVTGVGTISNGSITTLNVNTGNIVTGVVTNFTSTNGSITNLTGTAATITTLRSTTFNADTGNIVTGVTTNFTSTNGSITNLTGTSSTITTLRSTTLNADTGNIVTGVTTNFNSTNVVIIGVTTVSAGTTALPSISPSGDPNTGIFFPAADTISVSTGGTQRIAIDSSGNINIDGGTVFVDAVNNRLGIGITGPGQTLDVVGDARITNSGGNTLLLNRTSNSGSLGLAYSGTETGQLQAVSGGGINFFVGSTPSLKATIDSSGRLLIGTSSVINNAYGGTAGLFQVSNNEYLPIGFFSFTSTAAEGYCPYLELNRARGTKASPTIVSSGDELGEINFYGYDGSTFRRGASIRSFVDAAAGSNDMPARLSFHTCADGSADLPTERMRITNDGTITTKTSGATSFGSVGFTFYGGLSAGSVDITRSGGQPLALNRLADDGNLLEFYQNTTIEGTISVSGTTVSYNGAHLSRWSQLASDAERTEILRGSVLSNLDEMCEWGEEDNEQLNRMKVSEVEGDKNVSGVFQCWDDDDDTYTNDFYCAMTGDFIIRIAEGITVERGDLLMSAGDGTAKPQGDGYVQDKTIAKVTSTNVIYTYDDGSYCVPCVLMAC